MFPEPAPGKRVVKHETLVVCLESCAGASKNPEAVRSAGPAAPTPLRWLNFRARFRGKYINLLLKI
eukprot:6350811-Amphidinium_carterae.1